jgi:hypothetical protein
MSGGSAGGNIQSIDDAFDLQATFVESVCAAGEEIAVLIATVQPYLAAAVAIIAMAEDLIQLNQPDPTQETLASIQAALTKRAMDVFSAVGLVSIWRVINKLNVLASQPAFPKSPFKWQDGSLVDLMNWSTRTVIALAKLSPGANGFSLLGDLSSVRNRSTRRTRRERPRFCFVLCLLTSQTSRHGIPDGGAFDCTILGVMVWSEAS